ncbi:MAG TPA: translocation/assembly module TamB domain-containing protein [Steroidobacteraceae bacterium]|nr:translocation/assembly module TamB domain-containing protein [Steroidobacteraceae bacterium]
MKLKTALWRLLHSSWISLVLLLLAVGAALYYLTDTEGGLQWVCRQLSRQIGKTSISIVDVKGTLRGGFTVRQLTIDHPRVHIEIDDAHGVLSILPLAWQTIRVPEAHAARLVIEVHHYVSPGPPLTRYLPAFLSIDALKASCDSWTLIAPNGWRAEATRILAAGVVHSRDIRVYSSALTYDGALINAQGTIRSTAATGLNGTVRFALPSRPTQPAWLLEAQFKGDLSKLDAEGDFRQPFITHFKGSALQLTDNGWHWNADADVGSFDLTAWGGSAALGQISGMLKLDGDRSEFRANGSLTAKGLKAGPMAVEFAGDYGQNVLSAHRIRIAHAASGAVLTGAGTIGVHSGGPVLDLKGDVTHLRWPLTDRDAPLHDVAANYHLHGAWPYDVESDGSFEIMDWPAMNTNAQAKLYHDHLEVTGADWSGLGGTAHLKGAVEWSPGQRWQLSGHAQDLDLGQLRPGISGRIGFTLASSASGFAATSPLDVALNGISGTVRGQKASGHASFSHEQDSWQFRNVRVQLGGTRIEADGRVGADTNLQFLLDADDLGLLHQGAQGHLSARGSFHGDLRKPVLQATATGSNLKWDTTTLAGIQAQVNLDTQGSGRADVDLKLTGFKLANRTLDTLEILTQGTVDSHQVELKAVTPQIQIKAGGTGQLHDGEWKVALSDLLATDTADLHYALEAPAQLSVSPDRFSLTDLCVKDTAARICGSALISAEQRQVKFNAQNMPMQTLTAGLSADSVFSGKLNVSAEASARGTSPWNGTLLADLTDAAINHHLPSKKVETFNLGTGRVQANLGPDLWTAVAKLDAGEAGSIEANASARSAGDDWRDWPVQGSLKLSSNSLGYLESYVSEIDRAAGRVTGDLTVGGTVAAPQLNGELSLADGEFDIYEINLALRAVNFMARLDGNRLQLKGSANAGTDGTAAIDGDVTWKEGLPYGSLHLKGTDLRVANIPEARIQASPDVLLKLDGRRIDVTGEVTLPYARLEEPEELANAVLPSSDEVIVGEAQTPSDQRFQVFSNVTLKLGDRVTLSTSGLSGRLSGSLNVVTDESGISRGNGELNIEEGTFAAYGRKLDIERGRLLFNNGLLSDPGVDIRATKKFPDVTAGVNVRGTLRDTRMTFFSDPPITQSQIVSLLLAGGSLESVQSTQDTPGSSNSARSNALLQGGAIVAQQFGSKVGIEDVSVESDLNNETSLVLGRYLSPRLYVSYGISLAEAINTIKMRYTISDHWTIKTEAGTARSADLVYTFGKQ